MNESYSRPQDVWDHVWLFGGNGDGTHFYPGRPRTIGGTSDIPIEASGQSSSVMVWKTTSVWSCFRSMTAARLPRNTSIGLCLTHIWRMIGIASDILFENSCRSVFPSS